MQTPSRARSRSAYESCVEVCGNFEQPGLALDRDDTINFSRRETTFDQQRIEEHLDGLDLSELSLF